MTQYIPLIIYSDIDVLSGILPLPDGVRLSDVLNTSEKYIKFSKASTNNGVIDSINEVYVNKDEIKFVRTTGRDDGRGLGDKYHLHVKKTPVRTKMLLSDYDLSGNLYSKSPGEIAHLLESDSAFLPCTEVKLRHKQSNLISDAEFVAINRNKIYSIQLENQIDTTAS
jgi:hypothetical protein